MSVPQAHPSASRAKPARRLKPDVAARRAEQRRNEELEKLYETPVEQLSPEDIARMKAAFFAR